MFKIMITDDEQIVLDGISFVIEKSFNNIEIAAVARTGREAIEKARQVHPDLILMDIQMPGINGIEAIEEIKRIYPDIKFIIISAYEHFEYAKHAIELGVKEYILKPINRGKLVEVITKVTLEIEQERRQKEKDMENKEKLEKVLPILEHGFIYSVLLNNDYRNEISKYKELFEINKVAAYIMVLELGDGDNPEQMHNKIGSGIRGQKFYEKIRNTIKYKCKCIVGPLIINRMTILFYAEPTYSEYEQRIKAIELADYLMSKFQDFIDLAMYIGIGSVYEIEKINNSYEEALKALGKISGSTILHIKDITNPDDHHKNYTYFDMKNDEELLLSKVEEGREEEVEQLVKQFFGRVSKEYASEIGNIALELMVLVKNCAFRHEIQNSNPDKLQNNLYMDELSLLENPFEIQNWCLREIINVTLAIKNKKELHVSNMIVDAKKFIDAHYNKEISLKEVSKEVAISPQYFSKIFKDELGVNFIEYLTQVRMNRAKMMLREGKTSVKEICFEIGYNDPNYFSRLFKRLEGISPTEYK